MAGEMVVLQPWDRQPRETAKAFYAFAIYRDLGHQRSLISAAQKQGDPQALVGASSLGGAGGRLNGLPGPG